MCPLRQVHHSCKCQNPRAQMPLSSSALRSCMQSCWRLGSFLQRLLRQCVPAEAPMMGSHLTMRQTVTTQKLRHCGTGSSQHQREELHVRGVTVYYVPNEFAARTGPAFSFLITPCIASHHAFMQQRMRDMRCRDSRVRKILLRSNLIDAALAVESVSC